MFDAPRRGTERPTESEPHLDIRVLMVDDSDPDVEIVRRYLRDGNITAHIHRVETEEKLREALEQSYDIVFVDYRMPLLTASQAIQIIREVEPYVPILVMSGHVDEDVLTPLLKLGCDDFFLKDRLHRLPKAVRQHIASRELVEQRASAERARREAEARYRALFEQAAEGVLLVDSSSGLVIDANPSAGRLLNKRPEDLVNHSCEEVLPTACHVCVRELSRHQKPEGCKLEFRLICNGEEHDIEVGLAHVALEDGKTLWQVILRDITDRKRLERERELHTQQLERRVREATAQLEARNKELAAANEGTKRFLRLMNHELKTPLQGILGNVSTLERYAHDEEERETARIALDECHHLERLIGDMLDITAIETGTLQLAIGVVAPREVCERAANDHRAAMAAQNQSFTLSVDGRVTSITADRDRLRQVLSNLIGNAVKYTDEGGSISVRVAPAGASRVLIEVSDTGMGISQEDLPHIFREFYRSEAVRSQGIRGVGLGLALAKLLVEKQGGELQVESRVDEGSTFRILLPGVCEGVGETNPVETSAGT